MRKASAVSSDDPPVSPLLLSDHLITLAEQAGAAGYPDAARKLVALACRMLAQPPVRCPVKAGTHPASATPSRCPPPAAARHARRRYPMGH